MTRGRGWRRWRREVEKRRALTYYAGQAKRNPKHRARWLGIYSRTPKLCSCYACGNPRKHFGDVTIQEKRAA